MPENRFFTDQKFIVGGTVVITDNELRHLAKVMRKQSGDRITIINGQNQLAFGKIVETNKKHALVIVESLEERQPPKGRMVLAQALTKSLKLDWIIEKGTELGVDRFILFPGFGSDKSTLSENQYARLHAIRIAAIKQCGRLDIPRLEFYANLRDIPVAPEWLSFYCALTANDHRHISAKILDRRDIIIFIGTEKGWSADEHKILREKGCQPMKLHSNTLRAETAAIASLAIFSYHRQ